MAEQLIHFNSQSSPFDCTPTIMLIPLSLGNSKNPFHFRIFLSLGAHKLSANSKSGVYAWWGIDGILYRLKNSPVKNLECDSML